MHIKSGFTLIEILVVLVIIGITLGFALLAFGDFGASRQAIVAAEQFSSYIKLVQQRAILEMSTLGINVNRESYQTFRFEGATWKPMPEKSIFHSQHFPSNIVIKLQSNIKNNSKRPDIIINASGDMTAFKLDFGTVKKADIATLVGKHNGQLTMLLPKSS